MAPLISAALETSANARREIYNATLLATHDDWEIFWSNFKNAHLQIRVLKSIHVIDRPSLNLFQIISVRVYISKL